MGRKSTVTKEMILEAAYQILEEEGYGSVNIKTVAARVGCSTQPISWHFGNMGELRKSLFEYCLHKMWDGIEEKMTRLEPAEMFYETGKNYLSIAYDHGNVFRFLHLDASDEYRTDGGDIAATLGDPRIITMLAGYYGRSEEEIGPIVRDIVIYTHGLAMIVLQDIFDIKKDEAFRMIYNEGHQRFIAIGIDIGEMK